VSTLSDAKELYGTLETTWSRSRAHLVTHVAFFLIVFWLFGARIPHISLPEMSAKEVMDNDWFKLGKDTGLIYLVLIVPIALVAAYGVVLERLGQICLIAASSIAFSPRAVSPFFGLSGYTLEPLALLLNKTDFQLHDLQEKVSQLTFKFASTKSDLTKSYQRTARAITENSAHYFGDLSVLFGFWVLFFWFFPRFAWIEENRTVFWPVTFVLLCLIVLSWMRVSRALRALPRLQLLMIAGIVGLDPEFAALLEKPEAVKSQVRETLFKLLDEEQTRQNKVASLSKLIRAGLKLKSSDKNDQASRGWPFVLLFRQGEKLSWGDETMEGYRGGSMMAIVAYLYYSFYQRIMSLYRAGWQAIRYFVVGVPY
jgi:hypothetical protein